MFFESDMPNIDGAILLRNGTAIRDANSVLGILKFYLINDEDGQANQSVPAPQTTAGDKIFISHRSVDKKFAEIIEIFLTSCGVPVDKIFVPLFLVMILKKRFRRKSKSISSKVRLILSCYLKITTKVRIAKTKPGLFGFWMPTKL